MLAIEGVDERQLLVNGFLRVLCADRLEAEVEQYSEDCAISRGISYDHSHLQF
jgi:hypothetical protein